MKAIAIQEKKNVSVVEIAKPSLHDKPDSVLVRVAYAALDTALEEIVNKTFTGIMVHDRSAKPLIPGYHFSGTIQAVGSKVAKDDFHVGDSVFGHLQYTPFTKQGSCSEYVVVPKTDLAKLPSSYKHLSMKTAAACTTEGITALQALRDLGQVQAKDSVLIVGASGGVGSMAIGIAHQLHAGTVTAVCSSKDVAKVKALGANKVIDRTKTTLQSLNLDNQSYPSRHTLYNVIFDASGKYEFSDLKHLLAPGGRMVSTEVHIDSMLLGSWWYPLVCSGKSSKFIPCHATKQDLELVARWVEQKSVRVSIDSEFKVSDFAKAWERQNDRNKNGRVLIKVQGGW